MMTSREAKITLDRARKELIDCAAEHTANATSPNLHKLQIAAMFYTRALDESVRAAEVEALAHAELADKRGRHG